MPVYSSRDAAAQSAEEVDSSAPPTEAELKRRLRKDLKGEQKAAAERREIQKPFRGLLADKNGASADAMAEAFDVASGEELLQRIRDAKPFAVMATAAYNYIVTAPRVIDGVQVASEFADAVAS